MITSSVVVESVVRLRMESAASEFKETIPGLCNVVILAVSEGPGTFPPTQFAAVSQSPPVGAVVVFQVIVDITIRSSRPSSRGLRCRDRLRCASRPRRIEARSVSPSRGRRFMGGHLYSPEGGELNDHSD